MFICNLLGIKNVNISLNENKLEYVFCASIHFEEGSAVSFGKVFTIPKGCVTKLKVMTY